MKLSLSNGIFSKLSLDGNFAAVKELGFENIEFNMKTVRKENDTEVYACKKLLAASGLKCLTLHSATLHVKDQVEVHRAVYYGKISLEFAQSAFGANYDRALGHFKKAAAASQRQVLSRNIQGNQRVC